MSDCSKKNFGCRDGKHNASCVHYKETLPEWSIHVDNDCTNIEETTEELYDEISTLKDITDFSDLTSDCLDIGETPTPLSVAEALVEATEEFACEEPDLTKADLDITCYNLDFKCLADACDNPPTKLSELLQLIIDRLPCE